MTYATEQDLIDRFSEDDVRQVSDRDGDGVNDAAVIAGALSDADDTIDAYVGKKYDLPLATVPPVLVRHAAVLAFYFLHRFEPPDDVRKRYDDTMKFLGDVAAGRAELDIGGDPAPAAGGVVLTDGPERTFSRGKLEGF